MPYTLNDLTPEEKMNKYNQLNGTPDASNFAKFNTSSIQPTTATPAPKMIDFSNSFGGLPPVIAPTAKDLPKAEVAAPVTKPSVVGPKAPDLPMSAYNPAPFQQYTPNNTPLNFNAFEQRIRTHESNNNPMATNKNSSASGYYQFLWHDWHDSIKNVTGIADRDTFLKSPDAQKQFFKFYYDNHIMPNVQKIKKDLGTKDTLSDFDLAQLIHFRGASNAEKLINDGQLDTKKESYNPTALGYIMGK
jgi:hypothetical protein